MKMLAATSADKLQKSFLVMLCATIPGEVVAARNTVLRLSRTDPHDLVAAFTAKTKRPTYDIPVRKMAKLIWEWMLWGDGTELDDAEQEFVREMMDAHNPTMAQIAHLEALYRRSEERNV
jgi:hypothetical protein